MEYKCLIIDDEQLARELLTTYVEKVPHLSLVKACKNAMEGIKIINSQPIDLIFLDIQMPDLTGIDLMKGLRRRPVTVFTTAYQQYALEGYELDVADYLLKPFPFNRFMQAVNKACELIDLRSSRPVNLKAEDTAGHLIIKAEHKLHKVSLANVKFIEGLREYVTYHLVDQKIIALQALKNIESDLKSKGFVRVHKSYIVNKEWVELMDGNQLRIGEHNIPIGAAYKEDVLNGIFKD